MEIYAHELKYLQTIFQDWTEQDAHIHACEAFAVMADGLNTAREDGGMFTTMICDNEWNCFEVTFIASHDTEIMPDMVEIDGIIYNAGFAFKVFAARLQSTETVDLIECVETFLQ